MASGKSIADLPDELLLKIFSYLSVEDLALSAQHVNTHWRDVSQDDDLWRNKVFSPGSKITDEEIDRQLRNMPALRAFVPQRAINTEFVINTLCECCGEIRNLQFNSSQKLKNSQLRRIVSQFPNMIKFSIPIPDSDCPLQFAELVGQFQKLTTLSFTDKYRHSVHEEVLHTIAKGCPSLQHVNLGFTKFDDKDIRLFLETMKLQLLSFTIKCYISTHTHNVLANCINLEYLWYECYNEDLPDAYMQQLSNLSRLNTLVLSYFKRGQTRNIPRIFFMQSLPKLLHLEIYYCDGFDSSLLTKILTNCRQIQCLHVRAEGLKDDGFQHIGCCSSLEHLEISSFYTLTDKSLEYISSGCHKLKTLNVGHCLGLTKKSIEYLSSGCQKLENLNIQGCTEMTDSVFEHILKLKHLKVLNLSWNENFTGTHFHMIPSHLFHLEELQLEGCPSIGSECLDSLKKIMPNLKVEYSFGEDEELYF